MCNVCTLSIYSVYRLNVVFQGRLVLLGANRAHFMNVGNNGTNKEPIHVILPHFSV